MSSILCPGCRKPFPFSSWGQHIARSSNPACNRIYQEQQSYLPGAELSDASDSETGSNMSHSDSNIFTGDYFGDVYGNEDFPGWDGDSEGGFDSSDSNNSDSDSSFAESDLEPPAPTESDHGSDLETESGPESDSDDPMDDELDDERGRPLTAAERQQAEGVTWLKPTVQQFPGRAGEAIEEQIQSGYEGYKRSLGEIVAENPNNPYAPFLNKMDWEVARWSRLRGPGSTAFTELMGIENVC
jgi:hypothetical protein